MHLFLIRHGESLTNSGENFKRKLKDPVIPLTEQGKRQADRAGQALRRYLDARHVSLDNARVYCSPSLRAEETWYEIQKSLGTLDTVRAPALVCHQYGLFDAIPEDEWPIRFPKEFARYQKELATKGKFFARKPQGESPEDITKRLLPLIERLNNDPHDPLILVTHGTTIRAFLVAYFHYAPSWYHQEATPENGFIRVIEDGMDKGYLDIMT